MVRARIERGFAAEERTFVDVDAAYAWFASYPTYVDPPRIYTLWAHGEEIGHEVIARQLWWKEHCAKLQNATTVIGLQFCRCDSHGL
jgi:hypothetical protein